MSFSKAYSVVYLSERENITIRTAARRLNVKLNVETKNYIDKLLKLHKEDKEIRNE